MMLHLRNSGLAALFSLSALLAPGIFIGCKGDSSKEPAKASGSSAPSAEGLAEGDNAPDIELTLQNGNKIKLSSLKGKPVAIYFYPKDDTPGCTVEAQGIRDSWNDLKAANITVYGVSTQDAESHKQFIEKYNLPFDLVIDADESVAKAFGVPVRLGFAKRQSFFIGADGKVKKIWRDVKPDGHAAEILAASKS